MKQRSLQAPLLAELREHTEWELWQMGLLMLCLERVRPLWGEFGLHFRSPYLVLRALLRFLRAQQALCGSEQSRRYGERVRVLTRRLLSEIAETEGEEAVRALWNWHQTAVAEEAKWHWIWRILFYQLAGEPRLLPGLVRPQARRLAGLAEVWAQTVNGLTKRIEQMKRQPLEGWDRQEYRYSQKDEPKYDPLDLLEEVFERLTFDRVWVDVTRLLTPGELERLIEWGQEKYAEDEARPKGERELEADRILIECGRLLVPKDAVVPLELRTRN